MKTQEHAAKVIKRMVDEEQNDLEKIYVIKDICESLVIRSIITAQSCTRVTRPGSAEQHQMTC